MHDYKNKIKKHFAFTKEERNAFWIVSIAIAVILAIDVEFSTFMGAVRNLLLALIIAVSGLYAHHAGQRLWGLKNSIKVKQDVWWYGILIGLLLVVVTRGHIKFVAMTGTSMIALKKQRLGFYRYHPMFSQLTTLVIAGPASNIILATIAKSVEVLLLPNNAFLQQVFLFNIMFAFFNMLPIPPLDGSKVIFHSRLTYSFVMGTLLGYTMLSAFFGIYSWIWAFIIGVVCWVTYYFTFEKEYRES